MIDAASLSISAALIAGIAGSGHCFAMCGGLAGALGMRARIASASNAATLGNIAAYQLGRVGGYTMAGALAGSLGTALQSVVDLAKFATVVRVASGVLLVLIAIRILSGWNALTGLERLGAHLWRNLQPLAKHSAARGGLSSSLLLGLLWGWLPCGLVYSMLLFAALSSNAWTGAMLMLAFGIGTLPSMLASGMLAANLQTLFKQRWPRAVSGVLLLIFGTWMATAALHATLGAHEHAQSHQHHAHAP